MKLEFPEHVTDQLVVSFCYRQLQEALKRFKSAR